MHDNPFQSPASSEFKPPNPAWSVPWEKIALGLGLCGLLVALLLPAVRTARGPTYRASCRNNIKQISLAFEQYVKDHGSYPPAYTVDANGKPLHSWRTMLLPYLEQETLYKSIDLTKPWDDPVNAKALNTVVSAYARPTLSVDSDLQRTTYLAIVTQQSCLRSGTPTAKKDITDGLGKTVVVIEVPENYAVPWMSPQDTNEAMFVELMRDLTPRPNEEAEPPRWSHIGMSHMLFADGHIEEIVPDEKSPAERRALITIDGGEK
jgi:prepilin-type processing-associated H-X9-DG protein